MHGLVFRIGFQRGAHALGGQVAFLRRAAFEPADDFVCDWDVGPAAGGIVPAPVVVHFVIVEGHEQRQVGEEFLHGGARPVVGVHGAVFVESDGHTPEAIVFPVVGVDLVAEEHAEAQVVGWDVAGHFVHGRAAVFVFWTVARAEHEREGARRARLRESGEGVEVVLRRAFLLQAHCVEVVRFGFETGQRQNARVSIFREQFR